MAITTFVPDPLPANFILLPWSLPYHPRTGLNRRNAAVGFWTPFIDAERIKRLIGFVPGRQQAEILAMLPPEDEQPV